MKKRVLLPASLLFLGAASVWAAGPLWAQQLPELPIPGPGPHEERNLLAEPAQPTEPAQTSVPSARTDFTSSIIYFDSGKSELKPEAMTALAEVATALQANPEAMVTVNGHTDGIGDDAANLHLSQARSETVRDFLVREHGILAHRIQIVALGETVPVADNSTEEGRAMNRRVAMNLWSNDAPTAATGEAWQYAEVSAPVEQGILEEAGAGPTTPMADGIALARPWEALGGGPHEEIPPFA